MLIASYEQWAEEKKVVLEKENPKIVCEECEGDGVVYSDCLCCGHESEADCEVCEGSGFMRYLDSPKPRPGNDLVGRRVYFQEVIADLKKWCAYTRSDFLELAAPFIQEHRQSHG